MCVISIRVTKAIIVQVAKFGLNQRQICCQWMGKEFDATHIETSLGFLALKDDTELDVNELGFQLHAKHQYGSELDIFDELYNTLAEAPGTAFSIEVTPIGKVRDLVF